MNNLENIVASVLNDTSAGKIKYYFDGKAHPFVQLNASGADNDPASEIVLKGNANRPIRELVGLFDASDVGASWSVDGSWTNLEPLYALDVSPLWNGAKELTKETVVGIGGYVSKYAEPPEVKEQSSKVFFPSKGEYEANSVVSGMVYDLCDYTWSRSLWDSNSDGNYFAWFIFNAYGSLGGGSLGNSYAAVSAFNLDLEKAIIARSAASDKDVSCTCEPTKFEDMLDDYIDDVKFLAMTDGDKVSVEASHRTGMCIGFKYMTKVENDHTYLSSVITDRKGRILYYNVLKRISVEDSDASILGGILLPNDLPEGYKVGVFREVRNEAYYTDTCSEIAWLDV